jgi:hypothetical protein
VSEQSTLGSRGPASCACMRGGVVLVVAL